MTSGFYKLEGDVLIRAGKFVHAPTFVLLAEDKDTYAYPVDGWTWFDSYEDAISALTPPEDFVFME
jgi:hypothetical protein